MKTFLSWATIVAAIVAVCLNTPQARAQTSASPGGTNVAVIDLGEVFKEHHRMQAQLEDIKQDVKAFEAFLRQERKRIESMAEQLKTLKPGSPDYVDKEKAFASMQASAQVQLRQKSREFQEREARLRFNTYEEILGHVARFAKSYNIQLVIRFNRRPIDSSKPQSVVMGLSRPIVFQNRLDITDHIVRLVNEGGAPPPREDSASATRQVPQHPRR